MSANHHSRYCLYDQHFTLRAMASRLRWLCSQDHRVRLHGVIPCHVHSVASVPHILLAEGGHIAGVERRAIKSGICTKMNHPSNVSLFVIPLVESRHVCSSKQYSIICWSTQFSKSRKSLPILKPYPLHQLFDDPTSRACTKSPTHGQLTMSLEWAYMANCSPCSTPTYNWK